MPPRPRSVARKIATFARQPASRKRLAIEALVDVLVARMVIWRRGQYGALVAHGQLEQAPADPRAEGGADVNPIARDIGWAVNAVAPWARRDRPCLVDALAAARMLSRRSIPWSVTVGVARGDRPGGLIAHAWLSSGGRVLTGRRGLDGLTALATYVSRARPEATI